MSATRKLSRKKVYDIRREALDQQYACLYIEPLPLHNCDIIEGSQSVGAATGF